jgi:serine/threonine-protein kinase
MNPHAPEPRRAAAEICADALEQPLDLRNRFVERACGEDNDLRTEVVTLLRTMPEAGKWFVGGATQELETLPGASAEPRGGAAATGRIISHYRLEEFLGAGGMGEVYRATDVALGRTAAVKLLRPDTGEGIRDRLLREADAAAHLTHPAIAQFFDTGAADGVDWLAMEFVEGSSLRATLRRGPIGASEALSIASALLEAIVHAHAAGFLHRDIKPENIMVMTNGAVKLLDFGLAKEIVGEQWPPSPGRAPVAERLDDEEATIVTPQALTSHGAIVGTLGYMSPEQLQGLPVDERTDVFAMGVVIHEMLSGERLFRGITNAPDLEAISRNLPSVRPRNGEELPEGIDLILRRAVASDPAVRYRSAAAFLSELRATTAGESIAVLPNTLAITDLENLRASPEDDWIGSGIAESLAVDLRRAKGLELIPRAKVMQHFAALAAAADDSTAVALGLKLGCRWVLTGSYEQDGGKLRLTMHLIEVATGRDLWMEQLDGSIDDLFEMQTRLAGLVGESLEIIVPSQAAGAPRLDAFECYQRAKKLLHTRAVGQAEQGKELLDRALELAPDYAPLLATMAHYHAPVRWWSSGDARDLQAALEYSERAVAADPQLAEGHLWLGYAQWRRGDMNEAIESLQRVKELDPKEFQGWYFTGCVHSERGQWEAGLEEMRHALTLEPNVPYIMMQIGYFLTEIGDYQAAIWTMERVVEMEQKKGAIDFFGGAILLAEALRRAGRLEEARDHCTSGLDRLEQSDSMARSAVRLSCLNQLGRVALDQKDDEAARVAFEQVVAGIRAQPRGASVGWGMVVALAGLARAGAGESHLDEALRILDGSDYDFAFGMLSEGNALMEVALAARAMGRVDDARQFAERARAAGTRRRLD